EWVYVDARPKKSRKKRLSLLNLHNLLRDTSLLFIYLTSDHITTGTTDNTTYNGTTTSVLLVKQCTCSSTCNSAYNSTFSGMADPLFLGSLLHGTGITR